MLVQDEDCALEHPHDGPHERCEVCWLVDGYAKLSVAYHEAKEHVVALLDVHAHDLPPPRRPAFEAAAAWLREQEVIRP